METTLGNVKPFLIDVKGRGKASIGRKTLLRMKGGGSPGGSIGVLPSMPKGETIGNIVIVGKGAQRSST